MDTKHQALLWAVLVAGTALVTPAVNADDAPCGGELAEVAPRSNPNNEQDLTELLEKRLDEQRSEDFGNPPPEAVARLEASAHRRIQEVASVVEQRLQQRFSAQAIQLAAVPNQRPEDARLTRDDDVRTRELQDMPVVVSEASVSGAEHARRPANSDCR